MDAAQNGHSNVVDTLLYHEASVDMQDVVSTSDHLVISWDAGVVHLPLLGIKVLNYTLQSNNIQ